MSERRIEHVLLDVQRAGMTVKKGAKNPHFKAKYVTLDDLLGVVLPLLNAEDVLVTQPLVTTAEGDLGIQTRLLHVPSGTEITSLMPLNKLQKDDPQGQGSAITYGRRYSLMSLLGLVGEDDDDGNAASPRPAKKKPANVKKKPGANDASSAKTADAY